MRNKFCQKQWRNANKKQDKTGNTHKNGCFTVATEDPNFIHLLVQPWMKSIHSFTASQPSMEPLFAIKSCLVFHQYPNRQGTCSMQSRKGGHKFQASNPAVAFSVVEFQRVSWNMCPQVHEIFWCNLAASQKSDEKLTWWGLVVHWAGFLLNKLTITGQPELLTKPVGRFPPTIFNGRPRCWPSDPKHRIFNAQTLHDSPSRQRLLHQPQILLLFWLERIFVHFQWCNMKRKHPILWYHKSGTPKLDSLIAEIPEMNGVTSFCWFRPIISPAHKYYHKSQMSPPTTQNQRCDFPRRDFVPKLCT